LLYLYIKARYFTRFTIIQYGSKMMRRITEKDLLGRRKINTAPLEVLVQHNALNRTGELNYNKYGKKDRVGPGNRYVC